MNIASWKELEEGMVREEEGGEEGESRTCKTQEKNTRGDKSLGELCIQLLFTCIFIAPNYSSTI